MPSSRMVTTTPLPVKPWVQASFTFRSPWLGLYCKKMDFSSLVRFYMQVHWWQIPQFFYFPSAKANVGFCKAPVCSSAEHEPSEPFWEGSVNRVFDQDLPVEESPPAGLYTHTDFFTLATEKGPTAGANANERWLLTQSHAFSSQMAACRQDDPNKVWKLIPFNPTAFSLVKFLSYLLLSLYFISSHFAFMLNTIC